METVDSRGLLRRGLLRRWMPAAGRPCQHGVMDDDRRARRSAIADVPATFDDAVVLLDVREDDEWQRGHAPGAQHIPMGDVPPGSAEIDTEAQLFVVCHAGRPIPAGRAVPGPQRLRARQRHRWDAGLGRGRTSGGHRRRRRRHGLTRWLGRADRRPIRLIG